MVKVKIGLGQGQKLRNALHLLKGVTKIEAQWGVHLSQAENNVTTFKYLHIWFSDNGWMRWDPASLVIIQVKFSFK